VSKTDLKKIVFQVLANQQLEKNITEHKVFYKRYLLAIRNRRALLNKLHELHAKLEAIPLTHPLHINRPLLQVDTEIETFLQVSFSAEVLGLYNTEITVPPSKRKMPSVEESFWMSLLGSLVVTMEAVEAKYKQEWVFKKNFLLFLHSCVEYYGLHPDILRRNPDTYKRYNVIISHDFKTRKQIVDVKILVTKSELEAEFLFPYAQKLPIKINGKLIPFKNLCSVKYTSTLLLDDELYLYGLKNGVKWEETEKDELSFALLCMDETSTLHANPYLNGKSTVFRNNNTYFIDPDRINELKKIKSRKFDLTKLIGICEELNESMANSAHIGASLLVRALIDHVPPIFDFQNFADFANQYPGTRSFKRSMNNLNISLRNIADANIHTQVRKKDVLPTAVQTDFTPELDLLLSEVVRKLK
jgi:hypothetical protein